MIKNIFSILFIFFTTIVAFGQSEPTAQASALSFIGIKAYGMSISFQGSDADRYLILRSNSPITGAPTDGTSYVKGEWIGNGKVLANGANSFYTFREAVANTEYFFAIFAYNDGTNPNYLTSAPLSGSVSTKGTEVGDFYKNYRVDTDNTISDMSSLLKNHTDLLYGGYRDVVENVFQRDTFEQVGSNRENRKYIIGEYSNIVHLYEDDIDFNDYNREHVMARSWMPSSPPGNNDDQLQTSDYHNLYLVKASVNQALRSSHAFGEVVNTGSAEADCSNGSNANGNTVFEPREDMKGNIARTLLYMSVTYNGSSGSWAFNDLNFPGSQQDVDLLLQWHQNDPVDNFEIARNEYIYSIQNNRNPFIDFPDWNTCINFENLTLSGVCPLDTAVIDTTGIEFVYNSDRISVYPNPAKDRASIKLAEGEKITAVDLKSMNGKKVNFSVDYNQNIADLSLNNLSKGFYLLQVQTKDRIYTKKLLLTK